LPDSAGFGFWLGQLRDAQCRGVASVRAVVDSMSGTFLGSAEFAARARSNAQYVGDLYNAFLRRGADLDGYNFWTGQINNGAMTREFVRSQFVASPEFQGRVQAVINQGCFGG
jgi:hypothetical protein